MALSTSLLPNPEKLSQRLLKKVDISDPPVNLKRILSIWHNVNVVEEDLDGSGYLLPLGRLGAEIVVNEKDPEERRRFTIAHELGHWVLGLICEKKFGEFKQPSGVPRATLEKWCDAFATNLLMPSPLVSSWLPPRDQPLLIDAILRAATAFGVSQEAFFIRVWELQKIQVATFKQDAKKSARSALIMDRSYADEKTKKALMRMLMTEHAEHQLQIGGSMICFGLRDSEDGLVSVTGRKLAKGGIVLAVAWPKAGN
jgi:Zn-dependent peptidase ImmA (M78 family)